MTPATTTTDKLTAQATIPDRKPSKLLALYIPLSLGASTGLGATPACVCTWPELLLVKAAGAITGFVFWWIALMIGYHAYYFLKSLFQHPGSSAKIAAPPRSLQ